MGAVIQTRLTSDNKQHDEAFKKSKQQVYNYNKQVDKTKASVMKFAKSGLGALGVALGVAGGTLKAFEKTMRATQQTSDAFDNAMAQAKASVNYFFTSLSQGDFSGFIDGLKDVIANAKEAQIAIDNLQTATMLNSNAGAAYNAERSRLERIIKDPKSTAEEVKKAQDELAKLPEKYAKALDDERRDAEWTFRTVSEGIFKKYGLKAKDVRVYEQLIQSGIDYKKMVEKYPKLGLISDEDLKTMSQYYQQVQNLTTARNNLYSQNSRLLTKKATKTNTTSTTKTNTPLNEIDWNDPETINKYVGLIDFNELSQNAYQWRDDVIQINEEIVASEEDATQKIIEAQKRQQQELEKTAQIFSFQIDAINSLGSAFTSLGSVFESNGLSIAGIIAEAIANVLKGYATASAEIATAGPWAWAAFSMAGLAQVASVIAQIHNLSGYAEGGIIGGNSYTGDRVLARVNSGEMILNQTQQSKLFDMINFGGAGGGKVEFVIKGTELVGVLNNYNRKSGRVR